jgi:hypothetical protein
MKIDVLLLRKEKLTIEEAFWYGLVTGCALGFIVTGLLVMTLIILEWV